MSAALAVSADKAAIAAKDKTLIPGIGTGSEVIKFVEFFISLG
jgi:hypothetical protein